MRCFRQVAGEGGASALEMALILPLLLWLTMALVDAGRLLQAYLTVNHAAREAARFAVTGQQTLSGGSYLTRAASIQDRAKNTLVGLPLAPTGAADPYAVGAYSIRVNPADGGGQAELVEVEVYYTIRLFTPGLAQRWPYVRLAGYQRMLNERFGVVPSLDRANLPPTPLPLATYTPIFSPTPSPTRTSSPTPTATSTFTATATPAGSPTGVPSPSGTPGTTTPTPATSPTPAATGAPTAASTSTATATAATMPTMTATATASATASVTPTWTSTPTATATASPAPSNTATTTRTATPVATATRTPAPLPTPTPPICFYLPWC